MMPEYSLTLGNAVKQAREKMNLTQNDVAVAADIDVRTVLNIENYRGNPKLEVLYHLVRSLNLNAQEIFYPEMSRESSALLQLQQIIGTCSDEEIGALIPLVNSVLTALRDRNSQIIK